MARLVLMQKGVSRTYLEKPNCHHSSLVGLADPTSSLPFGSIFVSGSMKFDFGAKVVISRFPMTEVADCIVLELVRKKPRTMSQKSWDFLRQIQFGIVIFGNPTPYGNDNASSPIYNGQCALPELIAQGDLDGDAYFICWDPLIVQDALVGDRPVVAQKRNSTNRNDQPPHLNQPMASVLASTEDHDTCKWWLAVENNFVIVSRRIVTIGCW